MNVDPTKFTAISLFSGAAGLDLGAELAGIPLRSVVYVEREAYACEVLAARMEEGDLAPAPIWTDVTTFDGRPFRGLVDCVAGGFPCQDISVAGKQAGIEGARSGLWKHFVRIVEEVRPGLVIIENVAALRSKGLDVVLGDLAALGFDAEWGTLRASDVGATHHRDRIFIVAHHHHRLEGERCSRLLDSERETRGYDADGRGGEVVADTASNGRGQGRSEPEAEGGSGADQSNEEDVANTDQPQRQGHDGPSRVQQALPGTTRHLVHPPGPDELALWEEVLAQRPELEPSLRRVADGMAHRVDRLRLTGNGVVPSQAACAVGQLLGRLTADQ